MCLTQLKSLNNEVIFKVEVEDRNKLFFQSRFSSACHLMRILRIHLMIYLAECTVGMLFGHPNSTRAGEWYLHYTHPQAVASG